MNKLDISNACQACGVCFASTDLISEGTDGHAVIVGSGIVEDKIKENIYRVIAECPVGAISLVGSSLVQSTGVEGLGELKELVKQKLIQFKLPFPSPDEYEFDKDEFTVPSAFGAGEYRYEYRSSDKAEQAGLREFDRVMYSQSKAIIQKLLVEYKNKKLHKYAYYEREEGNYYYDANQAIQQLIDELVSEATYLSGGKISLPANIKEFEVVPEMGIKGDKFNQEMFVYQLRHLEELWYTESILNARESLSWYQTFVDTDDSEDSRGKDVYCYKNILEVCDRFGKYLLNDAQYCLTGSDGVRKNLETPLNKFAEAIEKEASMKGQQLIAAIDKIIH